MNYYDVSRYRSPSFSPSGTLAIVASDVDEQRLVTIEGPETTPQTIVDDESIADYGWQTDETIWHVGGDRSTIGYTNVDDGGTERHEIADTQGIHELLPDDDGRRIAALVTKRSRYGTTRSVQIYADGPESGPTTAVPANEYTALVCWDPDSPRLLLKRVHGTFKHDLVLVDCTDGETRTITDESVEARYASVQWGPDGTLYLVTDRGADTLYAARLDPDAGQLHPLARDRCWNVESIAVHESGRAVYVVNRDGDSVIHLGSLDSPTSLTTTTVLDLPDGVATHAAFDPKGNRLAVVTSTETSPSVLSVLDAETGAVEWSRHTERVPLVDRPEPTAATRHSTVRYYESVDGRRIPALVSEPQGTISGAIVDVHGGPEAQRRPKYRWRTRWFLDRGYLVVEPNVRGSTGYGRAYSALDDIDGRPDAAADVAAAGRWIRAQYDVDPVVVRGESHGGLLALVNGYEHPEPWDGVVSSAGIYDLESFISSIESQNRYLRTAEYGRPEDNEALFEALSPLRHADEFEVPVFVVHGRDDRKVPHDGATEFVEAVRAGGTDAEALLFDDEGHTITDREHIRTELDHLVAFFDRLGG